MSARLSRAPNRGPEVLARQGPPAPPNMSCDTRDESPARFARYRVSLFLADYARVSRERPGHPPPSGFVDAHEMRAQRWDLRPRGAAGVGGDGGPGCAVGEFSEGIAKRVWLRAL